jgi:hypothetical protein
MLCRLMQMLDAMPLVFSRSGIATHWFPARFLATRFLSTGDISE